MTRVRLRTARSIWRGVPGGVARIDGVGRGACARQAAVGIAHEIVELVGAERQPEVLRGDVLELVRFVHDQRGARRDDLAEVAPAARGVGAEQVVVDDDDVRFGGALAHLRDEAVGVARALGAEAGFGGGGDVVPQRQVFRQVARAPPDRRWASVATQSRITGRKIDFSDSDATP